MNASDPVAYPDLIPQVYRALNQVHGRIDACGLPRALHHLVQLRASQINACGYCIRMHAAEARTDGETNARLDELAAWRSSDRYTAAERAALAWTEALTRLDGDDALPNLRADLRQHFSDEQLAALTVEVAMINLWNRINVSNH